ncbi:hypothetical protein SEA_GODONK_102 [Gordonia phage GodonK]|nr:hypothetical protein HOV33_gp102 [Gordonia phage GodonK]QBZ72721.1 hypothetical protein SEA_GODONK_102 [Gordonia phage GodonK]
MFKRRLCTSETPCPQRPRWFLMMWHAKPWVCPQCGRQWATEYRYRPVEGIDVDEAFMGGAWEWVDVTPLSHQ